MKTTIRVCLTTLALLTISVNLNGAAPDFPGLGERGTLTAISFEQAGEPVLRGKNARQQVVVTGKYTSGQSHDLTQQVTFSVDNPKILQVDSTGFIAPLTDYSLQPYFVLPRESSANEY